MNDVSPPRVGTTAYLHDTTTTNPGTCRNLERASMKSWRLTLIPDEAVTDVGIIWWPDKDNIFEEIPEILDAARISSSATECDGLCLSKLEDLKR